MVEEDFSENTSTEPEILEEEKFDVVYECLRCNVKANLSE